MCTSGICKRNCQKSGACRRRCKSIRLTPLTLESARTPLGTDEPTPELGTNLALEQVPATIQNLPDPRFSLCA